jgi:NADPH2:quinone reductase
MRAIVVNEFGPLERLGIAEVAEPMPGADEVLVTVHAAPVNYVDLLVIGGTYQFLPPLPFIPGKGPAGVVTALGRGVTSLRVGDRVLAMVEQGGYAEAVTVRANQCYRLPPSMSFTEAASLSLVYDTAWFALRERARLESGETVLVLGASGGVGHAALQLAHALGARVLAGILRPERTASVRAAGADAVIDLSAADLRDRLVPRLHRRLHDALPHDEPRGDGHDADNRGLACPATLCATSPELLPISYVPCSVGELGPHRRGLQRKALRAPCEKKFELSHFRRAVGIRHRAHADQTIA